MLGGWWLHSSPDNEHRAWTGAPTPAAPHLRCGAACFCRWPVRGCWEEGVLAAGGTAKRAVCVSAPLMVGAYGADGCAPRVRGHLCAGGGVRRRRGRESCPRTRGLSPAGAARTRPRGMSPPASGMRSSVVAAEARDPCQSRRSPEGRRLGVRLEDVGRERSPST